MLQKKKGIFEGHPTAEKVTINALGKGDSTVLKGFSHPSRKQPKDQSDYCLARQALSLKSHREPEIIIGDSHPPDLVKLGKVEGSGEDHRMDVHVEMTVNMRKFESGGMESPELSSEFFGQLFARHS